MDKSIGDRIRIRREELGLTQLDLARLLGYKSRSSINKIELGSQNLTQRKIKAIADALSTTPGYIMGWTEEEKDPADMSIGEVDEEVMQIASEIFRSPILLELFQLVRGSSAELVRAMIAMIRNARKDE